MFSYSMLNLRHPAYYDFADLYCFSMAQHYNSSSLACRFSFNQLDLPAFETYDKLRENLLKAVQECSEGFGFA